jgi:hypothetical protein
LKEEIQIFTFGELRNKIMQKTHIRTQKEIIINYLNSTKFTVLDKALIAKLLKQQYKEGFINGMKLRNV